MASPRTLKPDCNLEDVFLIWYRNREAICVEASEVVDHLKEHETMVTCTFEKHVNEQHIDPDSEYFLLHMRLAGRQTRFQKTGDPTALIEAFLLAIQADIPPPPWILGAFHECLREWYEAGGKKTLDECFGLTLKQGQKLNALELDRQRQRDGFLCFMFFFLKSCLPSLSVETATRLVVDSFELPPESKIRNIGADRLRDLYYDEWEQIFQDDPIMSDFITEINQWTVEERRSFLSSFRGGKEEADKLLPPKTFEMNCLLCENPFQSTDRVYNRLCENCIHKNADD